MEKRIDIFGCSFSCDPMGNPWIGWPYYLNEYEPNIKNFNWAKSGIGNTELKDNIITYIEEMEGRNGSTDLLLIQWSAFSRCYGTSFDEVIKHHGKQLEKYYLKDWEHSDGKRPGEIHLDNLSYEITKNNLESILELQTYLQNKNIDYKMWFGWQQVYPEQIEQFGLTELLNKIKEDKNLILFKQNECYDYELEEYGLLSKSHYALTLKKLFGLDKGNYFHPATEWGGMTEFIRMELEDGKYVSKNDMHPSTKAQKYFFEQIIKNIIKEKFNI
jgi:hypothetical protein